MVRIMEIIHWLIRKFALSYHNQILSQEVQAFVQAHLNHTVFPLYREPPHIHGPIVEEAHQVEAARAVH